MTARSEYWWWFLFVVIVDIGLSVLDLLIGTYPILNWLFSLAVLLPGIAVGVRRLHDLGKPGWWVLIAVVPLIGAIILLIWAVTRGTHGENRFGADPLQA